MQGSISLVELWELLDEVGDIHGEISLSTLSRAVRNRLPSGHRYTRKKVSILQQRGLLTITFYTHNYSSTTSMQRTLTMLKRGSSYPILEQESLVTPQLGKDVLRCQKISIAKSYSQRFVLIQRD